MLLFRFTPKNSPEPLLLFFDHSPKWALQIIWHIVKFIKNRRISDNTGFDKIMKTSAAKHKTKLMQYLLLTVLLFAIIYCVVWIIYYHKIVKPHITEHVAEEPQMEHLSAFDFHKVYTVSQPADKSSYCIFTPGFGSYSFYVSASSGQSIDNGVTTNANGSDFDFLLVAEFDICGKIKSYKFNIMPMNSKQNYNLEAVFFNLNNDGDLLNRNDLAENEVQLYNDVKQEMIEYIMRTKQYFAISESK